MGDELKPEADTELDWLDQKLREEAPYIDDAGFTAGVMQKLPARRASRSLRAVILIVAAIVASGAAYILSGGGRFVFEAFAHAGLFSPLTIFLAALMIGLLMTGGAVFAALKRTDAL